MKKLLCGVAALPFLAGVALAQPMQLTNHQMDTVTAGWANHEIDVSNTSWTEVSVYGGALLSFTDPNTGAQVCNDCYLRIVTPTISVQSKFGPGAPVQ
jgi:hypothetical protein